MFVVVTTVICSYHKFFFTVGTELTYSLEENCELRGIDNVQGQISEHIFAPNGGYCLYIWVLGARFADILRSPGRIVTWSLLQRRTIFLCDF